mgnify:CR=1 FL=1
MAVEITKQSNGIDEMLTCEQRAEAEEYYKSKGVGFSAQERYEHFRDDPSLSRSIYYNVNYDGQSEKDISRLALMEWILWEWDGSI